MKFELKANRLKTGLAAFLAAGTLAVASSGALATDNWAEKTDFQKRIPGPAKFKMMEADYSGKVNTDVQFIADRQAIINHVTAYSYLVDEDRWDEWYSLFSDDIEFETTVPCYGSMTIHGKKAFMAGFDLRYRGPGSSKNTTVRRHTQGNVHVAEQTANTAEVRTYMLITAAPSGGKLKPVTTGTYNASLEKRDGKWTITRWAIETDLEVKSSPMPKGLPESMFKFTADDRSECKS
jgi:3-phenylpropionate/cinnamic acid dioxygenase small subunit